MEIIIDPAFEAIAVSKPNANAKEIVLNTGFVGGYSSTKRKSLFSMINEDSYFIGRRPSTTTEKKSTDDYEHRVIMLGDYNLIMPYMRINLLESASFAPIARLGTRNMTVLLKAKNTYYKKAKKVDVERLIPAKFIESVQKAFRAAHTITIEQKKYRTRGVANAYGDKGPGMVRKALTIKNTNELILALVKLYAIYATQLCTAFGKDFDKYGKAIISYAILGKPIGGKLPAGFKDSFKAGAKAVELKSDLTIDKLKPAHFKGPQGHVIVERLPQMYKDYISGSKNAKSSKEKLASLRVKEREAKAAYTKASQIYRNVNSTKNRAAARSAHLKWSRARSAVYDHQHNAKSSAKTSAAKVNQKLYDAVGPQVYDLMRLIIPALKSPLSSPFLTKGGKPMTPKQLTIAKRNLATARRRLERGTNGSTARRTILRRGGSAKQLTATQKKALVKQIAELEKKISDSVLNEPAVKSWMVPFVGANVEIKGAKKGSLDDGLLSHRLVTRANTGKLKEKNIELTVELDKNAANLLTLGGVSKIIESLGSSVKAFTTVFKNVSDLMRPKAFIAEFTERSVMELETETGKVSNTKLLRLNGITAEEQADIEKQYAKDIKAWKPEKEEISSYITKFLNSKVVTNNHYNVVKSTAAELSANRKMINEFFSHTHGVKELRVNKSWEVKPSKTMAAILKNGGKGSKLQVIRNVFHGTYRQAGSIILARGFKISGTKVTARSMGDVLYIAANADKSAQYMRAGGAFRGTGKGVTGMIFMGDCLVSGESVREAKDAKGTFGWTKRGDFKTEEIGLVSPNSQFIIRKAMIVTMTKDSSHMAGPRPRGRMGVRPRPIIVSPNGDAKVQGITKFEAPIPLAAYKEAVAGNTKGKKVSKKEVEDKVVKKAARNSKKS